jgi:hypothetical protein
MAHIKVEKSKKEKSEEEDDGRLDDVGRERKQDSIRNKKNFTRTYEINMYVAKCYLKYFA